MAGTALALCDCVRHRTPSKAVRRWERSLWSQTCRHVIRTVAGARRWNRTRLGRATEEQSSSLPDGPDRGGALRSEMTRWSGRPGWPPSLPWNARRVMSALLSV